jgi:transcriptional regulator with XRE-family HTH domain
MAGRSDKEKKEQQRQAKHKDRQTVAEEVAKVMGERIAEFRMEMDPVDASEDEVSQEELARLAGVDRSGLSALENGKSCSRLDTFVRLAGVMEVPMEELVRGLTWIPDGSGKGEFRIEARNQEEATRSEDAPDEPG